MCQQKEKSINIPLFLAKRFPQVFFSVLFAKKWFSCIYWINQALSSYNRCPVSRYSVLRSWTSLIPHHTDLSQASKCQMSTGSLCICLLMCNFSTEALKCHIKLLHIFCIKYSSAYIKCVRVKTFKLLWNYFKLQSGCFQPLPVFSLEK